MNTLFSFISSMALICIFGAIGSTELGAISIISGTVRVIIYTAIFIKSLSMIKIEED